MDCLAFHGSRTELIASRKTTHLSSPLGALTLSCALGFLLLASGCGSDQGSVSQTPTPTPTPTYSLGGTVSGLSGSGLTLGNGATTVPVAAGATSFTLSSALASGTTYAITVLSQPADQTCTVAQGSGTIGTANVGNVVVTCATQSFPLGGTITGLGQSTGLALTDGTDTLSVSAGSTSFTLPTAVAVGSSYAVTVSAQPTGLACSVSHGSGTMPASAVNTVQVSCTDQPFSLGGTISGLGANTGLVLSDGTDSLTVAANATTFTLPTKLAFGSPYAVTVSSAPAGLTCSVSNGSGTLPAANVTNVAITCSDQSFTLGGTIQGLSSTGLVLANNGDTLNVTSGATSFTMPTSVAYTSPYNIIVQTQPTNETCTVSNGSGTMPAANVTNVAVTCAVNTYTIGGSISGLTATGLVLQNNGADNTTIAANAMQFTLNTGLVSGSSYAITVRTQPSGLACTVTNGTGTVASQNADNVSIACVVQPPFTVLHTFTGGTTDGATPAGGLVLGADGNFYGTTQTGGAHNDGTIFEVTPSGIETVLYSFGSIPNDSANPSFDLIEVNGAFYGTAGGGGGFGTVFSFTPGTGAGTGETILHTFNTDPDISDGGEPGGTLLLGNDGNLYGETLDGGANGNGTVFKITTSGALTPLFSFNETDGAAPVGGLIEDSAGNFYGTAEFGGTGADDGGSVFQLTSSGTLSFAISATMTDGLHPGAGLILGNDGNYYGTASGGGSANDGTVFMITPAGVETVVYSFAGGSDGATPVAKVLLASDGNFYGTTVSGGTSNAGTIFRLTPQGVESVLYSFTGGSDGARPRGDLVQGSDGALYGTTANGGASINGVVFRLTL
jgi:uncharacterized repeat protein (TIGR03803 family)